MLGKDFFVFWQIAQSILSGAPLYASPESLYPPATLLFFTPLGLLPFNLAFAIWTGLNVILYLRSIKFFTSESVFCLLLFLSVFFIIAPYTEPLYLSLYIASSIYPWKKIGYSPFCWVHLLLWQDYRESFWSCQSSSK